MTALVTKPVSPHYIHLCMDAQRMFLDALATARTVFTRFIPAQSKGEGQAMWRDYYTRQIEAATVEEILYLLPKE
ncbi:MAG: hypothetical protein PSY14_07005 [bacterium]|nr:hypothetical protein [bacterium]